MILMVFAALLWLRAFRYMAVVMLVGICASFMTQYTKVVIEPQHIIALAMGTLGFMLFAEILKLSSKGEEKKS